MSRKVDHTSPQSLAIKATPIDIDSLYAAPTRVPVSIETASGPVEIEIWVQRDRISIDFMERMMALAEKARDLQADDNVDENDPRIMQAVFAAMLPWVSVIQGWNLSVPPSEASAKKLGIPILTRIVQAIQSSGSTNMGDEGAEPTPFGQNSPRSSSH